MFSKSILDKFSGIFNQYYAAVFGNFGTLSYTIGLGWSSPNIPILQSNETPLISGPLTNDEASWVSSILNVGGLIGTIVYGWSGDRYGRHPTLLIAAIPHILCWLLTAYGTQLYQLLLARFFCGVGGGSSFLLVQIYVSEISQSNRRGYFGSFLMITYNIGILMGFIMGTYLGYHITAYITLIFPILFAIAYFFLPETPLYLVSRGNLVAAKKSLSVFRDSHISNESFEIEMKNLEEKKIQYETNNENLKIKDFTSRSSIKAIIISFVLISMTKLCGVFVVLNYMVTIFQEANELTFTPETSAIFVAIIQAFGAFIAAYFVDKTGRKSLYIISSIGTGVSLTILGVFFFLNNLNIDLKYFGFIPIVTVCGILVFASWGFTTLPYVIMSEICSQRTRGTIVSAALFWSWTLAFLLVKYFFVMRDVLGLHGCMWFFAVCCFCTTFFVIYFMPETRGKSFDVIVEMLSQK